MSSGPCTQHILTLLSLLPSFPLHIHILTALNCSNTTSSTLLSAVLHSLGTHLQLSFVDCIGALLFMVPGLPSPSLTVQVVQLLLQQEAGDRGLQELGHTCRV
jgi:hypothetical protein